VKWPLPILSVLALTFSGTAPLHADGYPFNSETQFVFGDYIRLGLTEEQVTHVSATGRIPLNEEQLGWLRKVYPKIPTKLRVIAATFNDSVEDRYVNAVECFWIMPDQVAITLPKKSLDADFSFDDGDKIAFPADLRISPEGVMFHKGMETTLAEALRVIEAAKPPAGGPDSVGLISVTLPPPYPKDGGEWDAFNKKVTGLFEELKKHGALQKVSVQNTW